MSWVPEVKSKWQKSHNLLSWDSDVRHGPCSRWLWPGLAGDLWPHSASVSPNFPNQIWSLGSELSLTATFLIRASLEPGWKYSLGKRQLGFDSPLMSNIMRHPAITGDHNPLIGAIQSDSCARIHYYVDVMRKVILSPIKLSIETWSPII